MRNFTAALLAGGTLACVYYSYDYANAEETSTTTRISSRQEQSILSAPTQTAALPSALKSVPDPIDPSEQETKKEADPNAEALRFTINTLEQGIKRLEKHDAYTFTFTRQERIDGILKDEQEIDVKLRHAPFSVYMKWKTGDRGRELLYSENENDGRMLIKLGGLKGRFVPTLKIDPEGARAKAETRHSITRAGLANLAREILRHREKDLSGSELPKCVVEEGHTFNDRPCYRVYLEHNSPEQSPEYRKTITLIDKELGLPVYCRNYTWITDNMVDPEKESLVSCYSFSDIQLETELASTTWESENPDYRFR